MAVKNEDKYSIISGTLLFILAVLALVAKILQQL